MAAGGRGRGPPARRGRRRQLLERDAGLDPHLVQHRDEVLGGDVAGRPLRDRAAAQLAEARLERVDARLERRQHVGEPLAAGVVEVGGQLDAGQRRARRGEEVAHLARVGHPGRVAEGHLLRARDRARPRSSKTRSGGTRPRRGSRRPPRSRPRSAGPRRARARAPAPGRSSDSSIERLTFLRLWVSDAERNTLTSWKRSRWASALSSPRSLGIRTLSETSSGMSIAASTSGAVGELRDHVGAHEARDLQAPQARCGRAPRSGAPCRPSGRPRARSGTRRAGRPRGCGPQRGTRALHGRKSKSPAS